MNTTPPRRPPPPANGSLWLGFGLGWLIIVSGYALLWFALITLASATAGHGAFYGSAAGLIQAMWLLPWFVLIGLGVYLLVRQKTRTALGLVIAVASIFALVLLLVAACFGLFALGGWH